MSKERSAATFVVMFSWSVAASAQPIVTAVVNGASFQPSVPKGCIISIFGSRLAQSATSANTLPLPKKLADTVVKVGDLEIEAPLYFVSPGQINAQLPFEALGSTLPLVVTTVEGKSAPFFLNVADSGPGIFTASGNGKGRALVFGSDFQPLGVAAAGRPIILYATGLGPTDPPALSGTPGASAEPFNRVVNIPEVFIGESPARVDFAGLAPGLAGVYQLNVTPPQLFTDGLFIRSRGRTSNVVSVGTLLGGRNVSNASGKIEAIYPAATDVAGYSPLLLAAKFTARMDIQPSSSPFVIAAVSDAASSLITVDPASGTFEGTVTVPSAAARVGDFSRSEIRAIDFASCHVEPASGVVCFPFPNNIIPASRISPFELKALAKVPLPDIPVANSLTGLLKIRGTFRPGSTFVIDEQTNSPLSVFAGYLFLPAPTVIPALRPSTASTTLKLFIDGNLVDSTEVSYRSLP